MTHPDIVEAVARAIGAIYDGDADPQTTPNNYARAISAAQAALSAIHDAGLVIVPREPTEAMIAAAEGASFHGIDLDAAPVYRAMLTAHLNGDGE